MRPIASFVLSVTLVLIFTGCSNTNKGKGKDNSIPSCLASQIDSFAKKTAEYPPIQIDEYLYKGKRVFLFTADCCDQFNTVYDENCKAICSPSGGIEGGGDHKCEDFGKEAKLVKMIWSKEGIKK
jgi:predicted small secreted protein